MYSVANRFAMRIAIAGSGWRNATLTTSESLSGVIDLYSWRISASVRFGPKVIMSL